VMNRGRLIKNATVSELVGSAGSVYVEVDDRERAQATLTGLANVRRVHIQADGLVIEVTGGQRSDIASALVGAGLRLETIMPTQSLEDAFLELLAVSDDSGQHPGKEVGP
jgi:hypothetical protein